MDLWVKRRLNPREEEYTFKKMYAFKKFQFKISFFSLNRVDEDLKIYKFHVIQGSQKTK